MNVRTKLGLLLFAVVATFIAGLTGVKLYDGIQFRRVTAARAEERERSFDEFLHHWSEPLQIFVKYFGIWDDLVTAIERSDAKWAHTNMGESTLVSYRAHAVWAYKKDGTLAFTRNLLYSDSIPDVPLPAGMIPQLLDATGGCHFFAKTALGIMEIRGTTVRPSREAAAPAQPRGYFFAGRLWSNSELKEMSLFTGNKIEINVPPKPLAASSDEGGGAVITFTRMLPDWTGAALATLTVRNESPVVTLLNRSSERLFLALIAFSLVLLLVLLSSLTRWVTRPLKSLSTCLRTQSTECLHPFERVRDEFGDLARMMAAFFDQRQKLLHEMAERRQAQEALQESEERLRQSQKMEAIGRLAGGIAHDFNNLLTAIIGYAELIADRVDDPTTRDEAGLIRKAGEQAADLTRQLLAFSRKQILQPRVLDLNGLVDEMQKLLRRVIGEKIELRFEPNAADARVRADPTQIEQVLLNLGVNARDAMPRGGILTMRTADAFVAEPLTHETGTVQPGPYVTLTVQDTGCGMEPEVKARIFEPFFTTKSAGKGTGLGLATVYGIVQQSGGSILVSTQVGVGTTFTVFLPRADAEIEPVAVPGEPAARKEKMETVLVVEDEDIVRELIVAVLTAQGYEVLCAADGPTALHAARDHEGEVDLLVSDVIMPQITGAEVARALLAERPHTKVLFVSGYSEADISEDGVLSPGVHLLPKPFTPEALSRKVRELLDAPA
jgi:signal transduction histidine kinase/CheY-like chemotaxis protein